MLGDAGFDEVIAEDRTDQVCVYLCFFHVVNVKYVELPDLRQSFTCASVHGSSGA